MTRHRKFIDIDPALDKLVKKKAKEIKCSEANVLNFLLATGLRDLKDELNFDLLECRVKPLARYHRRKFENEIVIGDILASLREE